MAIRKTPFVEGEFYHIYNRGVDKRIIFLDEDDISRFFQGMNEFNVLEPIGSIYENSFRKEKSASQLGSSTPKLAGKLVEFVAYCLNPNHFHFVMTPRMENGVEKFMQKLGTGYTNYFNNKYKRSGALFQGKFKSIHINSNEYLLHVSAYVNLNNRVHQLGSSTPKLVKSRSSWGEYTRETGGNKEQFCKKHIVLDQFKDPVAYREFAESSLHDIIERKQLKKELEELLLE